VTALRDKPIVVPTREDLHVFYDAYFETLDDGRLEEWPDYFVDDCLYQIIPRENYEAGYKLCTIQADSKGMLVDRVQGILKTQMFAPRYCRRFYSGLRVVKANDRQLEVRQNVVVVQTLLDKPSEVLGCGVGRDRLVRNAQGHLKFVERTLVLDSEMVPNSFIYPA
jgi:3-phenylpropionate/cinnamic acid dioxygenase small subunit